MILHTTPLSLFHVYNIVECWAVVYRAQLYKTIFICPIEMSPSKTNHIEFKGKTSQYTSLTVILIAPDWGQ